MAFHAETAAASICDHGAIGERDFMPKTQLVRVRRIMRVMASLAGDRLVGGAGNIAQSGGMRVLIRHASSLCPGSETYGCMTTNTGFATGTRRRASSSGVERIVPFRILDVIGLAVMALGAISSREAL